MKKIIFILMLLVTLTLIGCNPKVEEVDDSLYEYSDFTDISLSTHVEAEGKSNDKYIVYYYSEACSQCEELKQDILGFANDFEMIDFYIFDISEVPDSASSIELVGTPTVIIFSGEDDLKTYLGKFVVLEFIDLYEDMELDYSYFGNQTLTAYSEILEIESDNYYVYYYLETCPNCIEIKETVLTWAFTKNVNNMYIMNGASVPEPDNFPTELQILSNGSPILIVLNNGVFTDEYYSGKEAILDFIESDTE